MRINSRGVLIILGSALFFSFAPLILHAQTQQNILAIASHVSLITTGSTVETLVCIRHGEKPAGEIGQLNAQGLNRSLALPQVLVSKFGKPQFIFAPDPAKTVSGKDHVSYCYIRPLATIEPTAILLGLPVNTLFGYNQIGSLQKELEKPGYANSLVFIAWEHAILERFVRQEIAAHGGNDAQVPVWKEGDYDSIYLLKLTRQIDGSTTVSFSLDHEGLDHLSKEFPVPASPSGT